MLDKIDTITCDNITYREIGFNSSLFDERLDDFVPEGANTLDAEQRSMVQKAEDFLPKFEGE